MSLSLVIAVIVVLDAALLAVLAWSMSHVRHLKPHEATAKNVEVIQFPGGLVAEVEMRRAA